MVYVIVIMDNSFICSQTVLMNTYIISMSYDNDFYKYEMTYRINYQQKKVSSSSIV